MGSSRAAPEPRSKDYWKTASGESEAGEPEDGSSSDTGSERSDGRRWNTHARFLESWSTKWSDPVGHKQGYWTWLLEAVRDVRNGSSDDTPSDMYDIIKEFADCEDPRPESANFLEALRNHRRQGKPTDFRPLLDLLAAYMDTLDPERKEQLSYVMPRVWKRRGLSRKDCGFVRMNSPRRS